MLNPIIGLEFKKINTNVDAAELLDPKIVKSGFFFFITRLDGLDSLVICDPDIQL